MAKAILSLFTNPDIPQTVVRELVAAGFARDDINLITEGLADKSISAPLPSRATVAQISAAVDSGPETRTHGVYDALIWLGVPDQEARYLYDTMGQGGALIYVTGDEAMVYHGRAIIERHHAEMSDRCAILLGLGVSWDPINGCRNRKAQSPFRTPRLEGVPAFNHSLVGCSVCSLIG